MEDTAKKKVVLTLRWTAIIVTSYLTLAAKGKVTDPHLAHLLVLGYLLSNLLLTFLPKAWFSNPKFFYSLVIVDTGIVSFGMYLSEKMATDFYLVFFLILISASVSRNFKLLMAMGGVMAVLYGVLLYSWGLLTPEHFGTNVLRVPFIFIMTAFYGYIVKTFAQEKHQQLTISENKYRGLFENANDGIIILKGPPLIIASANREAVRLGGFEMEELLGRPLLDLFSPAEKDRASGFLEEALLSGEGRTDSLSFQQKERSPLEVDLSIKRIDFGDEFFYQVIFRDLTEQRKLEKKIRESKMHLQAIFDGIQDCVSIQSPDYRILRVNRAVVEKYRTTFLTLIGKRCYEAYYQRSSPCEECPVTATIETREPSSCICKTADSDTTLRRFSYPILDEKGNLLSVIEYTQDITEEQRLQDQLIQSERLAGVGILAAGVAHEINNPLSGIVGMAEIAMEEENPLTIKDCLKDILNCGGRISEIVKGLGSYSRISKSGEQSLLDVNEILENSLKIVRMGMKTIPVEVVKQFGSVEKIKAHAGEVQQVFTNLITNAFQAMNGKGGTLTLSTRSLKDAVEVKVGDNGMGIPQKNLNKIFDPFFTTKKIGEGTGLGLNIVYRIVAKHEGTIDVESREGAGTVFTVRFPLRKEIS